MEVVPQISENHKVRWPVMPRTVRARQDQSKTVRGPLEMDDIN